MSLFSAEERKVRRYLDDNFQNRPELVRPDQRIREVEVDEGAQRSKRAPLKGTGPKTRHGKCNWVLKLACKIDNCKNVS